jgi:hypothetical protein
MMLKSNIALLYGATGDLREPALGAHLVNSRHGYTRHGIYVGKGIVVHDAGLSRSWESGAVEEVTVARFSAHGVPQLLASWRAMVTRGRGLSLSFAGGSNAAAS